MTLLNDHLPSEEMSYAAFSSCPGIFDCDEFKQEEDAMLTELPEPERPGRGYPQPTFRIDVVAEYRRTLMEQAAIDTHVLPARNAPDQHRLLFRNRGEWSDEEDDGAAFEFELRYGWNSRYNSTRCPSLADTLSETSDSEPSEAHFEAFTHPAQSDP